MTLLLTWSRAVHGVSRCWCSTVSLTFEHGTYVYPTVILFIEKEDEIWTYGIQRPLPSKGLLIMQKCCKHFYSI